MEFHVRFDPPQVVVGIDDVLLPAERDVERGEYVLARARRDHVRAIAFDRGTELKYGGQLIGIELGHPHAALGNEFNQPFGYELEKRFADGRAGDRHSRGDALL